MTADGKPLRYPAENARGLSSTKQSAANRAREARTLGLLIVPVAVNLVGIPPQQSSVLATFFGIARLANKIVE
jgi:hypothetical protein